MSEWISRALQFSDRIAIRDRAGEYRYDELVEASARVAGFLLKGRRSLGGARVAFQMPSGWEYVVTQWGIWRAGGVAVPISGSATEREKAFLLEETGAGLFLSKEGADTGIPGVEVASFEGLLAGECQALPQMSAEDPAMMLFTSGTTSRPKGVVTTHGAMAAQIDALREAWEWSAEDRIPLFLPLHHVHGIVNILSCALASGARVEAFPRFEMKAVLDRVGAGAFTVFMAVPTIYAMLLDRLEAGEDPAAVAGFRDLRLMVSGSAALPASLHERWRRLTGQVLLERYGMTETGMILSHELRGERRCGSVGVPLPGVEVRLVSETGESVEGERDPGEVQVRGPAVFRGYWNRPEATAEAFDGDWFRTGDLAVREDGQYRILGRLSVDIIKSGGYKLSALEIEAVFLEHPAVQECAVVGLPDEKWGETVAMVVVGSGLVPLPGLESLRDWASDKLSDYKQPRQWLEVEALPRNAMGKVAKREVAALFGV
ncbi:malonyl-CoA/methylmalonyl-CoA synthetase [Haloferula luteola]|uniref:Malonyl-CoA/methylmalonyl-CoA synthetase n=1 Tax=Haloferula luteola TaxID=595692 RepID=A0A840V3H0_9BACT|nr:acyl-CoA synthetase [Haloferula luteola]MBB5350204.1 malonyl-CoA/methylmalonyl-CoA synthetase [Haloferula luteola]